MTALDYDAIHRAATDTTGEDSVLMACAVALAARWGDPHGDGDIRIEEDPRTIVQVVLNTVIGAAHGKDGDRDPNRLARQLADAADERDAMRANWETTRDDLEQKSSQYDQATAWLAMIAEPGCETWTTGPGSCTRRNVGRWAVARYGTAYQWCDPCRAWAALNDVPMTTQPEREEQA